jgi:hypothetical protein
LRNFTLVLTTAVVAATMVAAGAMFVDGARAQSVQAPVEQMHPQGSNGNSSAPGPGAAKGPQQFHVEDGGTTEVLESIEIAPKTDAPFTLILQTEWVKTLSDGGTITLVNKRKIARDSKGRIYQERWFVVPKTHPEQSQMTTIQISDPNAHTHMNCFMLDQRHQCVLGSFTPGPNAVYLFQGPPAGPLPDDEGTALHEDLGKQLVSGVEATGTRDSIIYNPGVWGNDLKMTVEREYWYAPSLGINLLSKRNDPRIGKQTFTATNLILAEPDEKLFEIPEGFTVTDRRPPPSPAPTN